MNDNTGCLCSSRVGNRPRSIECASCSQGSTFYGVLDPYAVIGTVPQKVLDFSRLIRQTQDNFLNAAAPHQIDLIQEKRGVGYGNNRFGSVDRERPEPCAFATGEDKSFHGISVSILE